MAGLFQPGPYNPPTPFLPPTNTPSIFTATPVVIAVPAPHLKSPPQRHPFYHAIPRAHFDPFRYACQCPTTTTSSGPSVSVEVLGCNTSIDVTHGMGEVTNAFIILKNTGGVGSDEPESERSMPWMKAVCILIKPLT